MMPDNYREFIEAYLAVTWTNPLVRNEQVWATEVAVKLQYMGGDDPHIYLASIRALRKREGCGSAGLLFLCQLADRHQITLTGVIQPIKGLTSYRGRCYLRSWYRKFGFTVNKDWTMERLPNEEMVSNF